MKSWCETETVYGALAATLDQGRPAAVATLIRLVGSGYRKPGAKLLIGADGALAGNVSGGCLEEDLRERGLRALASGRPERVHYDTGADEDVMWGLGLGCNGQLDLWVQPYAPATRPANLEVLLEHLHSDTPFALHLALAGAAAGALSIGTDLPDRPSLENDSFIEPLHPPVPLIITGAGDDAMPVAALAAQAGFRVYVVDHRAAYLTPARFPAAHRLVAARPEQGLTGLPCGPRAMVVLMTHNLKRDQAWAAHWAATPIAYLGLLGPQARRDEITKALPPDILPRCHGPVGLDLGAEGADQIAISIVAELLAVQAGRPGRI